MEDWGRSEGDLGPVAMEITRRCAFRQQLHDGRNGRHGPSRRGPTIGLIFRRACWESCVMSVMSITPPHHPLTTTAPPRPLPSCLAQRLKTGTDPVKKQEVMKSGLAQTYQSFSFPPHQPQNSTTPLTAHRTPSLFLVETNL